jgi:hypothetical protein
LENLSIGSPAMAPFAECSSATLNVTLPGHTANWPQGDGKLDGDDGKDNSRN